MSFQSFAIAFPFLYFILPWIHFYDSSLTPSQPPPDGTVPAAASHNDKPVGVTEVQAQARNPHKDKTKPKVKVKAVDRLRCYFTAPVTKFHFSMVSV